MPKAAHAKVAGGDDQGLRGRHRHRVAGTGCLVAASTENLPRIGAAGWLGLNIRKTALVPLGEEDLVAVGSLLFQRAPGWAGLPIQYQATHLGFVMGPGRGTSAWSGPFKKVRERTEL